jgi:ribonucleotide reductase alpha subunit
LKALNDRMKTKETTNEAWPEIDEIHQTQLPAQTHPTQNSSVTINMNNSNELTPSITKEDLNQTYFDTEQQQQQPTS